MGRSHYMRLLSMGLCIFMLDTLFFVPLHANELEERLRDIKLPSGFHISVYAEEIEGARSLARGAHGTLFIGSRSEGNVYAVVDTDGDFRADKRFIIARGLNRPNGVAFRNGSLYVAEINRILRYDNIEDNLNHPPTPVIINDSFPHDTHHGWKFIRFGPDGQLYVPVGAPCNVCDSADPRYGSIMRMREDGSGLEIFAKGVRNTVGFDWHPKRKRLFFTDNGRDWLGNNQPPDELNMASRKGMHFGYPYCHGKNIRDPKFGTKQGCSKYTPPVMELGAHVAALGMRFYTGKQFPQEYYDQVFIAEHGSWNRFPPSGYRITMVRFSSEKPVSYNVFAEGWLNGVTAWGRPVDIEIMPDGSMLVSDDKADVVYRIWYSRKD